MKIIWTVCLCLVLALAGGAALAEGDMPMHVQLSENGYGFPMSQAQCADAGLTLTGEAPEAGMSAEMTAGDSGYDFAVRADNVNGEIWVTGFTMKNNGAGVLGLKLNASTREQALNALGEPDADLGAQLTYSRGCGNYVWTLKFSGDTLDAVLTEVTAVCLIAETYAMAPVRCDTAVAPAEGMTVQALLDSGWRLRTADAEIIVPAAGELTFGKGVVLCNGADFVRIVAYNEGAEDSNIAACVVQAVQP